MTRARNWTPSGGALVLGGVLCLALLQTPTVPVLLPPLPAPVHVGAPVLAPRGEESGQPLFTASRSNAPVGTAGSQPALPPPVLTGIVAGNGKAVAIVKGSAGSTILHVGETIAGWTLEALTPAAATFQNGGKSARVGIAPPATEPAAEP